MSVYCYDCQTSTNYCSCISDDDEWDVEEYEYPPEYHMAKQCIASEHTKEKVFKRIQEIKLRLLRRDKFMRYLKGYDGKSKIPENWLRFINKKTSEF